MPCSLFVFLSFYYFFPLFFPCKDENSNEKFFVVCVGLRCLLTQWVVQHDQKKIGLDHALGSMQVRRN